MPPNSDSRLPDTHLPRVVVANDDGIDAPGLLALVHALDGIADCFVVAPESPQSGVGHTLTEDRTLRVTRRERGYAVEGTPADCARIALAGDAPLLPGWQESRRERAVWLVSGINHGANLGVDTYVSGTAAAAREAAILGFPALAISQYTRRHQKPDWERVLQRARPILVDLLSRPPSAGAFWNVNLPHPEDESVDCGVVHCPLDPSPHAVRYERSGEAFTYAGDFHARPRLPGHDVDVCFGGCVAVTEIGVAGATRPTTRG